MEPERHVTLDDPTDSPQDKPDASGERRRATGRQRVSLRGEVVVPNLVVADRMLARMRGLLGRSGLEQGEGLWILPCPSIHMFFMRFALDIVFLDTDLQVVRVHEDVRPWKMARGGKHAHSVLELRTGTIAFYNLRVGDRLSIDPA
ncbi:MAG: putative secreted protein [Thermoleophilia bacterium]|nr:putative secreted protein [Thermoleophilia bacterium]